MNPVPSLLLISLCSLFFVNCNDSKDDPFATMKFDAYDASLNKRIEAYHDATFNKLPFSKSGTPALYIDFSSGINSAFQEPDIKLLITDCYNTLAGGGTVCLYKLGNHKVNLYECTDKTIPDDFYKAGSYGDNFAPIEAAVDSIVSRNNDALLVTDFEEFQNKQEVTDRAYLKPYFVKWLLKGNTIHFFEKVYTEGKLSKHIYFTIFNCGTANEASMISKLGPKLKRLNGFNLSNNAFKLTPKYPSEKAGGIFYDGTAKSDKEKNVLDLKETYVNGLKNEKQYEFYPFGLDWKTIDISLAGYKSQNLNNFFSKLFLDLSNDDGYTYNDFEVKVYDVSQDFEQFAKCVEAINNKPKMGKGVNGEPKIDDNEKNSIALACYDDKGVIRNEWVYKPGKPTPVSEFFTFNKEMFKNTKTSNNVELGVSFHPNFSLKKVENPDHLLRVDIVLISASPNLSETNIAKFKWINSKSVLNISLLESIKGTLEEVSVKPSNKVIHSYYVKTLQSI